MLDVKNRSFTVTAAIHTPTDRPTNGVIIAQGGKFGGWAHYVKEGRAKFVYNVLGMQQFVTEAAADLTPGSHQVRVEFAHDGGGLAKGGDITLYYDGRSVGCLWQRPTKHGAEDPNRVLAAAGFARPLQELIDVSNREPAQNNPSDHRAHQCPRPA